MIHTTDFVKICDESYYGFRKLYLKIAEKN